MATIEKNKAKLTPLVVYPTAVTLTIVGDLEPADTDAGTAGIQQGQDALGNVIVTADAAANHEDTLYDSSGSDSLQGEGGNDQLFGGAANESEWRKAA